MIESSSPEKFDFLSHPDADVLSLWLNIQSSGDILFSRMSTQMVITLAMNSNELRDDRNLKFIGNSNLQALPDMRLYPPIPNSDASER
jgi:hypothetical protein